MSDSDQSEIMEFEDALENHAVDQSPDGDRTSTGNAAKDAKVDWKRRVETLEQKLIDLESRRDTTSTYYPDPPYFFIESGAVTPNLDLPNFTRQLRFKVERDSKLFPDDQSKIAYALSRLGENAWIPFLPFVEDPTHIAVRDVDHFCEILTAAFGAVDPKKTRDSIENLIANLEWKLKGLDSVATKVADEVRSESREVTWKDFKSFVRGGQRFAIDILVETPRFFWERLAEERFKKFEALFMDTKHDQTRRGESAHRDLPHRPTHGLEPKPTKKPIKRGPDEMPDRIRINSPDLIRILKDVCCDKWSLPEPDVDTGEQHGSVVFLRPYKYFVYHEQALKERLRVLRRDWAHDGTTHEANGVSPSSDISQAGSRQLPIRTNEIFDEERYEGDSGTPYVDYSKPTGERVGNRRKAMMDLEVLVRFMENSIMSTVRHLRKGPCEKVCFQDLWYLFRPGDEVCITWKDTVQESSSMQRSTKSTDKTDQKKKGVWKVLCVARGRPLLSAKYDDDGKYDEPREKVDPFQMQCYSLDHNGEEYGPIFQLCSISPFEGEKEISNLNVVPLRFAKGGAELKEVLRERGKKFADILSRPYCYQEYSGWTLTQHPSGIACPVALSPERVKGPVITDVAAAARENFEWVLALGLPPPLIEEPAETWENWNVEVREQTDQEKGVVSEEFQEEVIYNDAHLDRFMSRTLINNDEFLSQYEGKHEGHKLDKRSFLGENDFVLLPYRICAFLLERREFALVDVDGLRGVEKRDGGWKELEIDRTQKETIKALVLTHFEARNSLKDPDSIADRGQDIVRGKGEGLIILLHGPPGVRKILLDHLCSAKVFLGRENVDCRVPERHIPFATYFPFLW